MPDLVHSLQARDLGHLRIVASLWGITLSANEGDAARQELAAFLLEPGLVTEIVDTLPLEARSALAALVSAGGRILWAAFTRQYGQLPEAGPGKRDREQVHLHPTSITGILFFRALIEHAFFDTPSGVQEFAYIPDDLLPLVHIQQEKQGVPAAVDHVAPYGRPATRNEAACPHPPSERLLDDATTLLAALRLGFPPPQSPIPVEVVREFLQAAGILHHKEPRLNIVKTFLEQPRPKSNEILRLAWEKSESFNELRQVPTLVCEGEWQNMPQAARHKVLGYLETIPEDRWWSLPAFCQAVRERQPDYQRIAGDYDSWFIKRRSDGAYLRGFGAWDEVDGALLRYIISGPLYWLGAVDLASPSDGGIITAFRRVKGIRGQNSESGKLHVSSQGRIIIPRLMSPAARYQLARFCDWEASKPDEYHYRVSTSSLKKAGFQGLKVDQLLSLLAKNSAAEVPPALVKALKRWEKNGTEARVETQTILRVSNPDVLAELRASRAGRFLGDVLGPVTIVVKPGAQSRVLAALAELGILADGVGLDPPAPKE